MRWRTMPRILALLVGVSLGALAMPPAVAACSCMQITMDDARTQADAVVFTGTVGPRDARGYPVTVTRWFKGGGIFEPRVRLHPEGFSEAGGGADCTVKPLPTGTAWIFITSAFEGMYSVNLCSPHAALATDEGQTMLADAVRVFGGGGPPVAAPPATGPPAAPSGSVTPWPDPTSAPEAPIPASSIRPLFVALLAILGLGVLAGMIAGMRRFGSRGD